MTEQLDLVCAFVKSIHDGTFPDTRPEMLKAITREAPTCEAYVRFFYAWVDQTKPRLVVETGTDQGRSGIHLAIGWPPGKVVSIDIAPHCSAALDAFGLPNVETVTGSSTDVSGMFEDASIDLLFLDSLHTYEHVTREIELFLPKMRKGGLVFMDDIHLGDTMERAWADIEFPKREISELHFTGFGVFEVP